MSERRLMWTRDDLLFLRKLRISPDDVCGTCGGGGCQDCGRPVKHDEQDAPRTTRRGDPR